MKITRRLQGPVAILSIEGPIVAEELLSEDASPMAPTVLDAVIIDECVNRGVMKIVLDLTGAPFIDSMGLEKIQNIASGLGKTGGDLRVCSLNDVCQDIFTATRMDGLVQVSPDAESAARSMA